MLVLRFSYKRFSSDLVKISWKIVVGAVRRLERLLSTGDSEKNNEKDT